jgi:hypothetical protein
VSQSGIDSKKYTMGWGNDIIFEYITKIIENQPKISATKLARKIVNRALMNDHYELKDDTSCGVIYFRKPRRTMLITGPPFYKVKDKKFINHINDFEGPKIICGGTTAEIVARGLDRKIKTLQQSDPTIPPVSVLEGFDLVTEGILTIGKIEEILENYSSETRLKNTPADEIVKRLLENDIIYLLVGTRINWAHQDPDQPVEIEIRKTVIKRIVKLLEDKFFKKVFVEYV